MTPEDAAALQVLGMILTAIGWVGIVACFAQLMEQLTDRKDKK